ncbi:MAG: Asp-tRNA(Asn)/Glu-tRNA(Gln) amidotransferase subunit GatC [Bacteroidetes bacterium]|nr:Asp-tRNA(Asn)/Glu-tRNA(Gln) amidotransferase subunit GatC [Bacteroidota bacterium]MCY4233628.1 Asp-tRNA(Asn)/Glu-tRNA(Gln) amidotransferase subunit GatC [Bacteroidota bacterium]
MSISKKEVRHIAELARLSFTEAEEDALSHEMSRILDYVDTLNQVDTSDIEPMTHVHDLGQVVRSDTVRERTTHEDAMENAPDSDGEYFRVPKVIG